MQIEETVGIKPAEEKSNLTFKAKLIWSTMAQKSLSQFVVLVALIFSILKLAHTESQICNCTEKICLPESYNRLLAPEERLPVYMLVSTEYFDEITLTEVDDNKFGLTLNIDLVLCWQDNRITFNDNSSYILDPKTAKTLWHSGLFIPRLIKDKKVLHNTEKLGAVRIFKHIWLK